MENAYKTLSFDLNKLNSAGQFYSIFNVTYGHTIYVRAYINYVDAAGKPGIMYSTNIVAATMTEQKGDKQIEKTI